MQLKSGYTLSNGKCRYVIESVLGKGGFGITYKVYSIVNNNEGNCIKNYFAIKVIISPKATKNDNAASISCSYKL